MEWNEAAQAELRRLWAEGGSTAEIGRQMGITKNMVVGKVHRMGLPGRESPISSARRSAEAGQRRAAHLPEAQRMHKEGFTTRQIGAALGIRAETAGLMLRQVGLAGPERRALRVGAGLPRAAPSERAPPERVAVEPPAPIAAHPALRYGTTGCRFPIGEPRAAGFRFCGAVDVVPGKPYCAACCALAYVQPLVSAAALAPRRWAA